MAIPLRETRGANPEALERAGGRRPRRRDRYDRRTRRTAGVREAGISQPSCRALINEASAGVHRMTLAARDLVWPISELDPRVTASGRDAGIDTMRGFAILMVIGIH